MSGSSMPAGRSRRFITPASRPPVERRCGNAASVNSHEGVLPAGALHAQFYASKHDAAQRKPSSPLPLPCSPPCGTCSPTGRRSSACKWRRASTKRPRRPRMPRVRARLMPGSPSSANSCKCRTTSAPRAPPSPRYATSLCPHRREQDAKRTTACAGPQRRYDGETSDGIFPDGPPSTPEQR